MSGHVDSVPFLDLPSVNGALQGEYELAWKTVLEHGRFVGGPEVERFEASFVDQATSDLHLSPRPPARPVGDERVGRPHYLDSNFEST